MGAGVGVGAATGVGVVPGAGVVAVAPPAAGFASVDGCWGDAAGEGAGGRGVGAIGTLSSGAWIWWIVTERCYSVGNVGQINIVRNYTCR